MEIKENVLNEVFQFTLPCGERHFKRKNKREIIVFQFTLPCGERQNVFLLYHSAFLISIHAPVWGATEDLSFLYFNNIISIHAPVWGAT